jgi:predicted GNAT family acetyltransferase
VRAAYRRRGIAAALTGLLTRACPTVRITTPFLMTAGPAEKRIYQRVRYQRVTESMDISR